MSFVLKHVFVVAAAAVVVAAAGPATASGAVATKFGGPQLMSAVKVVPHVALLGDGYGHVGIPLEPVDVTLTQSDVTPDGFSQVLVEDRGVLLLRTLEAEGGCTYVVPLSSATCPARFACHLVEGGPVGDVVVLRGGCMRARTAEGNDRVDSADGATSTIDCGPGLDAVRADTGDAVSANCENVVRV